jgi:hypothetical protein
MSILTAIWKRIEIIINRKDLQTYPLCAIREARELYRHRGLGRLLDGLFIFSIWLKEKHLTCERVVDVVGMTKESLKEWDIDFVNDQLLIPKTTADRFVHILNLAPLPSLTASCHPKDFEEYYY